MSSTSAGSGFLHPDVTVSGRPRAGRRFPQVQELDLMDGAVASVSSLVRAPQSLTIVSEMAGPFGIPDLTALVGDPKRLASRLALPTPPLLNQIDAGLVSVLAASRTTSIAAIAERLGWPTATIERRLQGLTRVGAVVERSSGLARPAGLRPVGRLLAVEAKVRDWRKALRQARTYMVWADSYVVVMGPISDRSLEVLRREVAADDGGLVVDGRWIRRPGRRSAPLANRMWASEHLVAALSPSYQPSLAP